MQSDGTDVASTFRSTLGFNSRADHIFGALGGSSLDEGSGNKNAPWTVSQDRVFRSGKEAYSSDEDEDAKEMDRRQKEILPESMELLEDDDEPGGEAFRPSAAFCRALDNEQEYDSIDAFAMAGEHEEALHNLASTTEVLEDNIYEQRAQRRLEADARADAGTLHAAGPQDVAAEPLPSSSGKIPDEGGLASESPAEPMETGQGSASQSKVPSSSADKGTGVKLHPALKSSKPEAVGVEAQQAPAAHDEDEQRRSKKKVRFQMDQPWVPPHRRSSDLGDRPRATMGSTEEGAAGKGPARSPREQRRRSFVPDHVRNPQRYTCYDLGESITVGGGDQGASAADGGQADMERAARSALSAASKIPAEQAAAEEESRELPAFGSGLEFRPQGKLAASKSSAAAPGAAQHANESGPGISVALEDELGDEGDDMEADEQVSAQDGSGEKASEELEHMKPATERPRAQRNFRSKA